MAYPQQQASEIQKLINLYRARPDLFDTNEIDQLGLKAQEIGINFKPLDQHVSLKNMATQFSGGFIEGFTTIPISDRPRTTYESIARSLGHLAGFAPAIMTAPLKGVGYLAGKTGLKGLEKGITKKAIPKMTKFGEWSLPMIGSKYAKKGVDKIIDKTKLDALSMFKTGGVGEAITKEAVGLGTASVVSNVWHGTDEYLNSFVGGAVAGGMFGGIGNFVRLGNIFKGGSKESIQKAESALKAGIGASVLGLPSTLRDEPIEMQLYEYLLGGFFGYQSRPAHQQAGSKFINDLNFSENRGEYFKPSKSPRWDDLSNKTKEYVNKQATDQSRSYINKNYPDVDLDKRAYERVSINKKKPTSEDVNREIRTIAYEIYNANRTAYNSEVARQSSSVPDTQEDFMDDYTNAGMSTMRKANRAFLNQKEKEFTTPIEIAEDIDATVKASLVNDKPNVESFVELLKDKSYNLGSEAEARNYYHQASAKSSDVFVLDYRGGTPIATKENGKVGENVSLGRKNINFPLNELSQGEFFDVMTHVLKRKKGRDTYEGIFKTNLDFESPDGLSYNISNKELYQMQTALNNQKKYIYSGVKDKDYAVVSEFVDFAVREGKEVRIRMEDIYDALPTETANKLRSMFTESLKAEQELNQYKDKSGTTNKKFVEELHERKFVSNILHDAHINNAYSHFSGELSNIGTVFSKGYGANVIDFNKRMQGYVDSGVPQVAESYLRTAPNGQFRTLIINDVHEWNVPDSIKKQITGNSDTDGGTFLEQSFFADGVRAMGLPNDAGQIKPVVMGKTGRGNLFNKSNGQRAEGIMQEYMEKNNIQAIMLDSSAKLRGDVGISKVRYEGGELIIDNPDIFTMGIESLRINPSTYENPTKFSGNINIPLQLGNVLNTLQTKKGTDLFYKHFVEPSIEGTDAGKKLIQDIELISKLKKSPELIDEVPIKFIIEKLNEKNTPEANAVRKAIQKIRTENSEVQLDTDSTFDAFHDVNRILFELADGMYIPNAVLKVMRKPYENMLRKYIIKRYRNPLYKNAGKSWLKAFTPDMLSYADMVGETGKRNILNKGEILLDEVHRNTPAILEGKQTTLGKIWKSYKNAIEKGLDPSKYEDALQLLALRTPADSISGVRVLKLVGFTNQKGAGAITHHKDNVYLGGADKDSDYISWYQGVPKGLRKVYSDKRNERAHLEKNNGKKQKELDKKFGTSKENLGLESELMSRWSPSMRINVHKGARKGMEGLGFGLSAKEVLLEVAHQVKKMGGTYEEMYYTSNGKPAKLTLHLKKNTKGFFDNAYMIVNASADASKYKNIHPYSQFRDMLVEELFDVEYMVGINQYKGGYNSIMSSRANNGDGTHFSQVGKLIGTIKRKTYGEPEGKFYDFGVAVKNTANKFEWGNIAGKTAKRMHEDGAWTLLQNDLPETDIIIKDAVKEYTKDKSELTFLSKHVSQELKALLNFQSVGEGRGNAQKRNLALDSAGKNIANISAYELINETALDIYRDFLRVDRNNPENLAAELHKIANKALKISKQLNDSAHQNGTDVIEDIANSRYKNLDSEILDFVEKNLAEFSRKNKISLKSLKRYFELWMLAPYRGNTAQFKYDFDRPIWGSEYVTNGSKRAFFERMEEVYQRANAIQSKEVNNQLDTFKKNQFKIKDFSEFTEMDTGISKAVKTSAKIKEKIIPDSLKRMAISNIEDKEINRLENNLKDRPYLGEDFNQFFMDFTYNIEGVSRTANTINMKDIYALNRYVEDVFLPVKDRTYLPVTLSDYWADPRTVGRKHNSYDHRLYEQFIVPTDGNKKHIKLKSGMSTIDTIRGFMRKMLSQQNAHIDRIHENTSKIFGFRKNMNVEDQQVLMNIISARRNLRGNIDSNGRAVEESILGSKESIAFLKSKINGRKGEYWAEYYDRAFTKFFDGFGMEWLWTKDIKGNRFDWKKFDSNPKYGEINEYIRYNKEGRFDFNHFLKHVLKPVDANRPVPLIGLEQLLRFQYEYVMEQQLAKKNPANAKAFRELYRKKKKPFRDIGFIKTEDYFPRMNHGYDLQSQRMRDASIEAIALAKKQEAIKSGSTPEQAESIYNKAKGRFNPFIDSSLANTTHLEKPFLDYMLEGVGFNNRPDVALERGRDYIGGFDRRPMVIDQYKERFIRSYFKALSSIQGNNRIDSMMAEKPFDTNISEKRINELKKAGYSSQSEVWGDYLKLYLRDSLGHPSRFTHRMINSMEKGDPLALKKNPYFLTSDYYLSKKLEKTYNRLSSKKWDKFLPFFNNAPEGKSKEASKAREEYFIRRIHDLGHLEAKYNLLTLLANTGSMVSNIYGGAQMTIASAGLRNFVRSKSDKIITDNLLKNQDGSWALHSKGKAITNRKELMGWLVDKGVIDSYIANELEYNSKLSEGINRAGQNGKNFLKALRKTLRKDPLTKTETIRQLAERYGLSDLMLKTGGAFMQYSERINRIDAFLSHSLQAQDRFMTRNNYTNLNDSAIFEAGMKGIETTQFLYHSAFRPAFMRTATGKVLTRFKLFAFQSVRTRKEFYKQAKYYNFEEGTPAYNKFKDLFLLDMFGFALASAFAYSLFDTTLPPPFDWIQESSEWLFGDKRERDRAFFGVYPSAVAPLQIVTPPIARVPQAMIQLINGDWDRFADYTIHTLYPFGRLYKQIDKTAENPKRVLENFMRLPANKLVYRYRHAQEDKDRRETIERLL